MVAAIHAIAFIAALSCLAVSPKQLPGARRQSPKTTVNAPAPSEPAPAAAGPSAPTPWWPSDYAVTTALPGGGLITRTVRYPVFYGPSGGYTYWPLRRTPYVAIGREPTGPAWSPLDYIAWAASHYTPVPVVREAPVPVSVLRSEERGGAEPQPARERKRETFGSRLAPMLGGEPLVTLPFAVGEAKLRKGKFGEAIHAFSSVLKEAPEDPTVRLALALAFIGAGSYESAARMLREGLDALPTLDVVMLKPAGVFGDAERYAEVLGRLKGALEADPSNADLRLLVAFLSFAARDREAAGDLLEPAGAEEDGDPQLEKLRRAALGVWPAGQTGDESETDGE